MRTKPHKEFRETQDRLPQGGILWIQREGRISQSGETKARPFLVVWQPTGEHAKGEEREFHSRTTMISVALEFLVICAQTIKPEVIVFDRSSGIDLVFPWRQRCRETPELAKIKTNPESDEEL